MTAPVPTADPTSGPTPPSPEGDWPAQAADAIVKAVDKVRDQSTRRAEVAAKGVQYGPAIAVFGLFVVVALTIMLFRAAEVSLIAIGEKFEWTFLQNPMWGIYTFTGLVFTLAGFWCWKKARP